MPVAPELSAKYELTSPSGYRVVLNDSTDADFVGPLIEHSGFDSPEVREDAENRPAADGGLHGIFLLGRRPMTMTGKILNPVTAVDRSARIEKLSAAVMDCLRSDGMLVWTLASGQKLQAKVRTQQPLRIEGAWQKQFQIAMVASDPLFYSTEEKVAVEAFADAATPAPTYTSTPDSIQYNLAPLGLRDSYNLGAMPFPLAFPISWAAGPVGFTTHTVNAINAGDAPTFPRVIVTGGFGIMTAISVVNATTGKRVTFYMTLNDGETMFLNMRDKIALKNDTSAYPYMDVVASDWWSLVPGTNVINVVVAAAGNPSSGSSLQVLWRDAWR